MATLSNLWESTKPRITALVLVATFIGFYLAVIDNGSSLASNSWLLFHMLLGSAFVAGGVGTLNEFLEWEYDLRMNRTKTRPIPAGKITPTAALVFGTLISLFGMAYLAVTVNSATSLLAGMTLLVYLFVYTPLKRKTTLNTLVGAIPGALPPVGGWLAVKGTINPAAWILFGILFLWQIPHFFSIARIYRKDYRRAGFKMLPVLEEKKAITSTYIVTFCAALLICSLALSFVGLAGNIYLLGAALVGVTFLFIGIDTALHMSNRRAKRLLVASFVYLPALMVILILDRSLF